jgi:hypothetical protein
VVPAGDPAGVPERAASKANEARKRRAVVDLTESSVATPTEPVLDLTGEGPAIRHDVPPVDPQASRVPTADPLDPDVVDLTDDPTSLPLPELCTSRVDAVDGITRAVLLKVYDRLTVTEQRTHIRDARAGDRLAQHILATLENAQTELVRLRTR